MLAKKLQPHCKVVKIDTDKYPKLASRNQVQVTHILPSLIYGYLGGTFLVDAAAMDMGHLENLQESLALLQIISAILSTCCCCGLHQTCAMAKDVFARSHFDKPGRDHKEFQNNCLVHAWQKAQYNLQYS